MYLLKIREKEIKDQKKNTAKFKFFEELFSKMVSNSNEVIAHYLQDIKLPKLTKEQSDQCEGEITENEVKDGLGNIVCNKTPKNDGLTSEIYKAFGLNSKRLCYVQ